MLRLFKLRDRLCGLCGLCLSILLSGCGGGGGGSIDVGAPVLPGTGSGSGAGSTSSASVTLAVSSPTLTVASPVTVTLTVRDAKGSPMAGAVIDLSTERGTLASLNVVSVATDAKGNATALLSAPSGGLSGADQVIGVAKLGTTTVQGSVSFTVASSQPTIGLTISASTLRGSTGAETLRALVKDAAGSPATNTLVSFTSVGGRVVLGAPSAKTDGLGVATVTAAVGDSTLTAADTLTVSATVGTVAVTSALVVQLLADLPSLSVTASNSNVTAAAPATLSILVKSSTGLAVGAGTLVKVSSLFGLSAFDAVTLATNSIGMAQLTVTPRAANSNGADQIDLTSTVGGVTITVPYVVQVSSSNLNAPPVLQT